MLVGSCIGVFFLSVLSEFLRFKRSSLVLRKAPQQTNPPLPVDTTNDATNIKDASDFIEDQSPDELSGSTVTLSRETGTNTSRQEEYRFVVETTDKMIINLATRACVSWPAAEVESRNTIGLKSFTLS